MMLRRGFLHLVGDFTCWDTLTPSHLPVSSSQSSKLAKTPKRPKTQIRKISRNNTISSRFVWRHTEHGNQKLPNSYQKSAKGSSTQLASRGQQPSSFRPLLWPYKQETQPACQPHSSHIPASHIP